MTESSDPEFWNEQYRTAKAPWDLGGPTPVFKRLAEDGQFPPGRMLVLCAGRGHDARLFARHGFEVVAVDFAASAVADMKALAQPEAPVEVLQADIFALPDDFQGRFDYVLEYTCFCALDPERRSEYADLVATLIKPTGTVIILAFPLVERAGGPPYAVSADQMVKLFRAHGFQPRHREMPADSAPNRRGIEELIILSRVDGA